MRRVRGRLPELLVALGLALAAGVAVAVVLTRAGGHHETAPPSSSSSAPTTTTSPPTSTSTTAAPAPEAPVDLRIAGLSAFAATITWRTTSTTVGRVALGTAELGPTRWLPPTPQSTTHSVTVQELSFPVSYRAWITSTGSDGREQQATLDFTTPPPGGSVTATTRGGTILVDGSPWFPLMVYGPCSSIYPSLLADGITLFAQNPCGGLQQQLTALGGHALSAGLAGADDSASGSGLVGAFYPDEADSRGIRGAALPAPARPGLRWLTLSNHVFSGASPPPGGRGVYAGLVARSDVVGFDLYPLQGWCSRDRLGDVYAAQRELVALAGGRPTFQWIEAAGMNCPTSAEAAVTPDTVRAESWLAIAGGARGLGYFPAAWTGDVGGAIRDVAGAVGALLPALVSQPHAVIVSPAGLGVYAAAWAFGGAVYAVAVNAGTAAGQATMAIPGLSGRTVSVLGENRQIEASGAAIADHFEPLQVHLYVAAP